MKRTWMVIALALAMSVVAAVPSALAGATDALLLTCMDYRLTDDVADYMQNQRHMKEDYDQVILAGASLGANNTQFPEWGKTFWEHLDAAIALHNIHKVMILDHRNCGAYKLILKQDFPANANAQQLAEETTAHKKQLDILAETVHTKYPKLEVETMLMSLDGKVEEIGEIRGEDQPEGH